jgi:hypothetical protein
MICRINLTNGATAMRFSWTGLVLAPLLVPMVFSMIGATMLSSPQERSTRPWDF